MDVGNMRSTQTNEIKKYKGEENMSNDVIESIYRDIENYEEAIRNAQGALDQAERELVAELAARGIPDENVEDFPEY